MILDSLQDSLDELPFETFVIGDSEFEFAVRDNFEDFQRGFRIDENGKRMTSEEYGAWKDSWYTVAVDDLGDPIFIDLEDGIIYTSQEEDGKWEPIPVASSLEKFKQIALKLKELSQGRETIQKLAKKPVSPAERKAFYDLLSEEPEEIDIDYWIGILES